jgi:hypothetical protein
VASIRQVMKCFCKVRELQSLYTHLLEEKELSEEEKELILELIQCAAGSSKKIKSLCSYEGKKNDHGSDYFE